MIDYNKSPVNSIKVEDQTVFVFDSSTENMDASTVKSFGEEWTKFNSFTDQEIQNVGNEYFDIVSPEQLNKNSLVLDVGCGSGRWSKYVADKVGFIEAIDPSDAVFAAARLLSDKKNVRISKAGAADIPFADGSFDFVFSLGVLHHIPDTQLAMKHCINKLKPGGFFLVYLYYSLDNRGMGYKLIFQMSNIIRRMVSSLPSSIKKMVCDLIAVFVYLPLIFLSKILFAIGMQGLAQKIPLAYYTDKSFRIVRNDSLDRFGTPLEQRFSKQEIETMMTNCGLTNIRFSDAAPFWHAVGKKSA